jgi:uncharacterized NAD(P)/FAD-binding protein YdhS
MKTVAIVGGGFSGTMTAVNLARFSGHKIRIVLINAKHPAGRGVAYGTRRGEHLLNVAARNMSAVPDHPQHFLDWLRTRSEYSDLPDAQLRETYAPRRVYGDYVRSLLHNYCKPIDAHHASGIELLDGEVVDIQPVEGDVVEVILADGGTVTADRVLLATGNQPPARLLGENGEPFSHPVFAADPWFPWQDQLHRPQRWLFRLGCAIVCQPDAPRPNPSRRIEHGDRGWT